MTISGQGYLILFGLALGLVAAAFVSFRIGTSLKRSHHPRFALVLRTAGIVFLLLLLAVPLIPIAIFNMMERVNTGPTHQFVLKDEPTFLSEELALKYARETLASDHLAEPEKWVEYDNTNAPDGTRDHLFARTDPNSGQFQVFTSGQGSRTIHLKLAGNTIEAYIFRDF